MIRAKLWGLLTGSVRRSRIEIVFYEQPDGDRRVFVRTDGNKADLAVSVWLAMKMDDRTEKAVKRGVDAYNDAVLGKIDPFDNSEMPT